MIRPVSLTAQAFRGWRGRVEIPLDRPITVIVGENRAGKSSTANAIEWCLYGSAVEKGGSGIAERADWEVRPRGVGTMPTEVRVVLDTDSGRVEICRRREADAAARADVFEVHLAEERVLSADEARAWLRASDLPDWETYRRAHCFHQEAARGRVITLADRSAVLTSLLGLDEDARVRDTIAALARPSLVGEADATLDDVERSVNERLARPRRDLAEVEDALAARGVAGGDLGPTLLTSVRVRIVDRATTISTKLDLESPIPDAGDAGAVRAWARTWTTTARRDVPAIARLPELRARRHALSRALTQAEPARAAWTAARERTREDVEKSGDGDARQTVLAEALAAEVRARDALQQANALAALLRDARKVVDDVEARQPCPVCTTPIEGLADRIDDALRLHGSEEVAALTRSCDQARRAREGAERGAAQLAALREAEKRAAEGHAEARQQLAALLGATADDNAVDLVAAARARLEKIDAEGKALAVLETERDAALAEHADDVDLLRDLERWAQCSARAERVVDLDGFQATEVLQGAIDEAAAFAADVEALGAIARVAQEERSARRETEVNKTLAGYFALLTDESETGAVRIEAHRTAKRLSYRLLDGAGRPAAPVLNQAGLNALSLAMLFSQAEAEAGAGRLAFVVLDDPVQSLDEERQEGLARAIERLSETCAVLVATTPSHLVDRVRDYVSTPRRLLELDAWDPARGSALLRTEEP